MPDSPTASDASTHRGADGVCAIRGASVLSASCPACGWTPTVESYHGIRMAARRHAATSGHVVRVESSRLHYYDGRGPDAASFGGHHGA